MNPRFLPGGDKYDECREDDRRAFYERVAAEQEEILSALRTVVSCWTENEIEAGNNPTFEQFRDFYPEWNHEPLYETIGEVMHRVKHSA
jgi:hypothetical protein